MVVTQKGDQTIPVCSECSKGHHGVQFLTMGSQFHIPIVHCTLHIASDGINTVDSRANNTGDTHFDFPVLLLVCKTALWLEHFTVHVTIASFCCVFHTRIICPLIHTAPVTPRLIFFILYWLHACAWAHMGVLLWMTVEHLLVAILTVDSWMTILWVAVYGSFAISCMSQLHIATNLLYHVNCK